MDSDHTPLLASGRIWSRGALPVSSPGSTISSDYRALRVRSSGAQDVVSFPREEITTQLRITSHDIRVLDSKFLRSRTQVILAREHGLVVSVEHVKAVISHDTVWWFEASDPLTQTLIESLKAELATWSRSLQVPPFEFLVLDKILESVCSELDKRLQSMSREVSDALTNVVRDASDTNLMRLLPRRTALARLEVEVREVRAAIQDLLDSDEDMAAMYLSHRQQHGAARDVQQHVEAEILLEEYLKQVDEIAGELDSLRQSIDATEAVVNIELSNTRNRIMRFDLVMTIATFALSIGGVGAGLFGMNMNMDFLAKEDDSFALTTSSLLLLSALAFCFAYLYCRIKRIL